MSKILKLAYTYRDELQEKYSEIIFKDKYKYYNCCNWWGYEVKLPEDSYNSLDFVSVDKNDEVIGYLRACIDRSSNFVDSLAVINFYDINITFSKDFYKFLIDLFTKFNFRKVSFTVVIGNPAEKLYNKYIEKYGGRIVGIEKEDVKLQDGEYYDKKLYEIFREDFLKHYKLKKK